MGLAIAVVIGGKLNVLVAALVDHIIMPALALVIPTEGDWRAWAPAGFGIGPVAAALLEFAIVAWVVFVFAKKILREEKVGKK